jgi:hypothetical protein
VGGSLVAVLLPLLRVRLGVGCQCAAP